MVDPRETWKSYVSRIINFEEPPIVLLAIYEFKPLYSIVRTIFLKVERGDLPQEFQQKKGGLFTKFSSVLTYFVGESDTVNMSMDQPQKLQKFMNSYFLFVS